MKLPRLAPSILTPMLPIWVLTAMIINLLVLFPGPPLHATATLTRLGLLELALQPEDLLLVNLSLSSVSKSFKEAIRGIIVESPCRMADLYLAPRPLRSLPTISKVLHELYLLVLNPPLVIVPSLNSWQSMKARVIISRKMVGILERVSSVGMVQS